LGYVIIRLIHHVPHIVEFTADAFVFCGEWVALAPIDLGVFLAVQFGGTGDARELYFAMPRALAELAVDSASVGFPLGLVGVLAFAVGDLANDKITDADLFRDPPLLRFRKYARRRA